MTPQERVEKMAAELFDRLYGQPREDLDKREMKIICEWIEEAERAAVEKSLKRSQIITLLVRLEAAEKCTEALKALGSLPEGFCFCSEGRDGGEVNSFGNAHTGECADATESLEAWRKVYDK